jgi:hypothetical protein
MALVEKRHRDTLAALRLAQRAVCTYMGPTCDCKYGASGEGEQTGCPELRDLIDRYDAESAHPAPSAPAEFVTADVLEVGTAPNGQAEVILTCSVDEARKWARLLYTTIRLGLEPPKGKESP